MASTKQEKASRKARATIMKKVIRKITPTSSKSWKARVKSNVMQRLRSSTRSIQSLLHEELERNSVMVDSPCAAQNSLYDFFISEEELLQLQEEIEQDRDLERTNYEEALIELAQSEDRYLQDQIDDYDYNIEREEAVLCPICHENYLITGISCPGTMDESCCFHVPTNLSVLELKEILGTVYEHHALSRCPGELAFHIRGNHLRVSCSVCETSQCVI